MIWFQIIDPYLTNPSRNFYEGYSCAMRYDSSYGEQIRGNYLYEYGYRGVDTLDEAQGRHDELLFDPNDELGGERTENFPWVVNKDKTFFVRDDGEGVFEEHCNIVRDFRVDSSGIPLFGGEKLELTIGYKVY